jgi:hypothetical protein
MSARTFFNLLISKPANSFARSNGMYGLAMVRHYSTLTAYGDIMNTTIIKSFMATVLLGIFAHSGMATAKSLNGALGNAAGATDFYRVTCSKNANGDTDNLKVSLLDLAPVAAPLTSVQVVKGIMAKNTTDAIDGDTLASPAISVNGGNGLANKGNGVYDVRVNKTAAGIESYTLSYSCLTSTGKATAATIARVQNQ